MRSDLLGEVWDLSVAERMELAEAIWDTVAEGAGLDELAVPATHQQQLDRRLAEMKANPDVGSAWDEVRSRLEQAGC